MKLSVLLIYLMFVLAFSQCDKRADIQNSPVQNIPVQKTENKIEEPEMLSDYFVKENSLFFNGFDILRLKKKIKLESPAEKKSKSEAIEVSYAVLKKKNKILKTFDGVYSGVGNGTDFCLFPFLGKDSRLLAVSQTIPRGGRHWIADLSTDGRVIFDSEDYGVGREEFSVLDLDNDGTFEILFPVTAFYSLGNLAMSEIPMPTAIFKYDLAGKKYLPANSMFQSYLLNRLEERKKDLQKSGKDYMSETLDLTLQYIYAGKEKEAWGFFDSASASTDKEKVKAKVRAILKNEKIYQSLYRIKK